MLHRQRGQGLVEFAVIFPIFVFILFAVIDGGLLMGRYNDISNASKEGARVGAVGASKDQIIDRVVKQAHGGLDDNTTTDCAAFDNDAVTQHVICVEWIAGPNGETPGQAGASIRIKVKYEYDFLTPITNWIGGGVWDVKVCAVQRQELSISPDPDDIGLGDSCDD